MNDTPRVTNATQTTAKNDAWVVVTVKIERSDGSTSQVSNIEPRTR